MGASCLLDESAATTDAFIRFLNMLPDSPDLLEWTSQLRDALCELLSDVDDVWVAVNGHFIGEAKPLAETGIWVMQTDRPGPLQRVFVDGISRSKRLSDWIERSGVPIEGFHPPVIIEYSEEGIPLGAVILWRAVSSMPISGASLELLRSIDRLFVHLFVEHLLLHRVAHPGAPELFEAMQRLAEECGLTKQEQRVLNLRLFGLAYKEIADELGISVTTVSQHLSAAHRKAGVHSQMELFAKYFAPSLGLKRL